MSISVKIADAIASSTAGTARILANDYDGRDTLQVQVQKTGTATVDVEGRCGPDAPWVVIANNVADGSLTAVPHVHEVRVNVSAWTSGVVNAWLN